jgi:hypothetical protein
MERPCCFCAFECHLQFTPQIRDYNAREYSVFLTCFDEIFIDKLQNPQNMHIKS